MVRTLDNDVPRCGAGVAGGSEDVINDVNDAIECRDIRVDDIGFVHHRTSVADGNGDGLALCRGQFHAVFEVACHVNARYDVVLQGWEHVIKREHIELAQVHEVH